MRTLAHLSDLHFGRVDEALIEPLIALMRSLRPDVLVVSGDITQRAKSRQFKAARQFLDALPTPQVIVPGNHDVPLRNIFDRFFRPLVKYRRYVCDDLEPIFVDDEIAVLGVNTARSATFKNGRINVRQISRLRTRLQDLAPGIFKVVVTHHPFDLPDPHDENDVVGRSRKAMEAFAACGVDLLLAGHMHATSAGVATHEQSGKNYSAVAVQAGTTTSVRRRNEPNSFNFIFADRSRIEIQQFVCDASGKTFSLSDTRTFIRSETGWSPTA